MSVCLLASVRVLGKECLRTTCQRCVSVDLTWQRARSDPDINEKKALAAGTSKQIVR